MKKEKRGRVMGDNNLSPATSTRQPQITSENTLLQWAVVNSINTATAREDTTRPTAPADMQPIVNNRVIIREPSPFFESPHYEIL